MESWNACCVELPMTSAPSAVLGDGCLSSAELLSRSNSCASTGTDWLHSTGSLSSSRRFRSHDVLHRHGLCAIVVMGKSIIPDHDAPEPR